MKINCHRKLNEIKEKQNRKKKIEKSMLKKYAVRNVQTNKQIKELNVIITII